MVASSFTSIPPFLRLKFPFSIITAHQEGVVKVDIIEEITEHHRHILVEEEVQ